MHGRRSPPSHAASQTGSTRIYRAEHDPDSAANLSTTVAHAIADCMGVDVSDGSFTLYDAVDPDALDAIFRPRHDGTPRTGGHLTFFVNDYRVTVYADGEILIEPPRP